MSLIARILLLGSGELGSEFVISAKRLGAYVDRLRQLCRRAGDAGRGRREVFPMLDGERLRAAVERHRPDFIVPEVEAIRTEELAELEAEGWHVVPSARAAAMTMNRDAIRELAAETLGLRTSRYRFAESLEEVREAAAHTGLPCVVKPVMSSSGKGQSTVAARRSWSAAWDYAVANMRGDRPRVIVEEFVDFDYEITLLTVRTATASLLPADRTPAGAGRLSGELAAGGDVGAALAAGAGHGARGGRRSRRLRPVRGRILRARR